MARAAAARTMNASGPSCTDSCSWGETTAERVVQAAMTAIRRAPHGLQSRHAESVEADAPMDPGTLAAFVGDHTDDIVETWRELVRWDPALPHGSTPAVASAVVTAVARRLGRPPALRLGAGSRVGEG